MAYPLTEDEFRDIYAKVPRLCVDLVVRNEKGVLLTKRSIAPYKDYWHLPGGTVYFGESILDAIKRVAREELGVAVEMGKILDVLSYPDESKGNWHGWPIGIATQTTITSGELKGDKNTSQIGFFREIPKLTVTTQKEFLVKLGL